MKTAIVIYSQENDSLELTEFFLKILQIFSGYKQWVNSTQYPHQNNNRKKREKSASKECLFAINVWMQWYCNLEETKGESCNAQMLAMQASPEPWQENYNIWNDPLGLLESLEEGLNDLIVIHSISVSFWNISQEWISTCSYCGIVWMFIFYGFSLDVHMCHCGWAYQMLSGDSRTLLSVYGEEKDRNNVTCVFWFKE